MSDANRGGTSGTAVETAVRAGRLTRLLLAPLPVPLRSLAAEVDALGKAGIGGLVARTTGRPGKSP